MWAGSRAATSAASRWPTQRNSGCSWSKLRVASAPAISNCSRFLRPGDTWLTTTDPATPWRVRNNTTMRSSVVTAWRVPSVRGRACPSKAWLSPALTRSGTAVTASAATAAGRSPGTQSARAAQWAAMSAKARQRPTPFGIDAPVVVVLGGEPVLQVATVDQADGADGTRGDARPRLAHQRIEAVCEGDDGHDPGGVGGPDQVGRLVAVDGQGLLADDVLAGGQGRLGERRVQVVGRADVADVDLGGGHCRLGAGEGPVGPECLGCPPRTRGR